MFTSFQMNLGIMSGISERLKSVVSYSLSKTIKDNSKIDKGNSECILYTIIDLLSSLIFEVIRFTRGKD